MQKSTKCKLKKSLQTEVFKLTSRTPPMAGLTAALETKMSIPPNLDTACKSENINLITCLLYTSDAADE